LIELTTGTLAVSVDTSLARLARPAKAGLVEGLGEGGSVESKVASKGGKVGQVPSRTV
jgi:hypothetical protein